jgi:hypothetical protein
MPLRPKATMRGMQTCTGEEQQHRFPQSSGDQQPTAAESNARDTSAQPRHAYTYASTDTKVMQGPQQCTALI